MAGITNAFQVTEKEVDDLIAEAETKMQAGGIQTEIVERTVQFCNDVNGYISTIGVYAFRSCNNLSMGSFPACSKISGNAFYDCKNLISLYFMGSQIISLAESNAFVNTPISNSSYLGSYGSIFVPSSLYNSYISSRYWSAYSERIVGI